MRRIEVIELISHDSGKQVEREEAENPHEGLPIGENAGDCAAVCGNCFCGLFIIRRNFVARRGRRAAFAFDVYRRNDYADGAGKRARLSLFRADITASRSG